MAKIIFNKKTREAYKGYKKLGNIISREKLKRKINIILSRDVQFSDVTVIHDESKEDGNSLIAIIEYTVQGKYTKIVLKLINNKWM